MEGEPGKKKKILTPENYKKLHGAAGIGAVAVAPWFPPAAILAIAEFIHVGGTNSVEDWWRGIRKKK